MSKTPACRGLIADGYPACAITRSKWYSSITAATARLPLSSPQRTTRPVQLTSTSVSAPTTAAGSTMRKRIMVPTGSSVFMWNRTPPAEISAVSAKCSRESLVRMVMGSRNGNLTALLRSITPHLYDCLYTCSRTGQSYFGMRNKDNELLRQTLEFCYFGKVEIAHLHGRDHHVKRLFATGAHRPSLGFNAGKHIDQALIEAEIPDAMFGFAIFDEEGAVARHSCKNLLVRINLADVPQPGDQNSTLRPRNHLLNRLLATAGDEDNVGWRFPHLIGQGETVTCGRDCPHFAGVI